VRGLISGLSIDHWCLGDDDGAGEPRPGPYLRNFGAVIAWAAIVVHYCC